MSSISNFVSPKPRRQVKVFTASDAAYAIPAWAQGGNGIAIVTGTAAGASGSVSITSGNRGAGGAGGAHVKRLPVPIPAGVTTIAVAIGSPGAAVTATAATAGNAGGDASLTVGGYVLTLKGGGVSAADGTPAQGGVPQPVVGVINSTLGDNTAGTTSPVNLFFSRGYPSQPGSSLGRGAGGPSPFGFPGNGLSSGPTVTTNGDDATGFGAGGAGALWISGAAAVSGAGAPAFFEIEFVEGV